MGTCFGFVSFLFHHFCVQLTTKPLQPIFPPPQRRLCMAVQGQESAGTGCRTGTKGKGIPLTPAFLPNASCPGTVAPAKHPEDRLGRAIPKSMTSGCQLQKSTLMQSMATTKLFSTGNISILASKEPLIRAYAVFLPALKSVGVTTAPRACPFLLLFSS